MTTADARRESWQRFMAAIEAGIKGDYALCDQIVEAVNKRFGEEAAKRQKLELWNFLRTKRPRYKPGDPI